jgi:Uma2 family endonuclease
MSLHEIVLPETEPGTSRVQAAMTMRLDCWARGRGEAGPEWRFRLAPPGETRRPLVPDVAYVTNEHLRPLSDEELETPPIAPDVAVEILSPGDRRADVDEKIAVYLRSGSQLVIVVGPMHRVVELHDPSGTVRLDETQAIEHVALPQFLYPVRELFAVLRRP